MAVKKQKSKRKKKRVIPIIASVLGMIVLVSVIAGCIYGLVMMEAVAQTGDEVKIEIATGATSRTVAQELYEKGLIRDVFVFDLLCRYYNVNEGLKVGVYQLSPTMDAKDVINTLKEGPQTEYIKVSLPEGFSVDQIVARLVENGLGQSEEFYQVAENVSAADYSFLEGVPDKSNDTGNRLEGFLFPDTYTFDKEMTPKQVLDVMLKRFEKEVTEDVKRKLAAKNMSVYDWVIKASIVEREAVKDDERAIIAGVFENRLKQDMKLESCATVQYVLKENKPVLSEADTKIASPYNTYQNKGLPPGPIACPGKKSLDAALNPAETKYLFFCAKADQSHLFAETNAEHERNKREAGLS